MSQRRHLEAALLAVVATLLTAGGITWSFDTSAAGALWAAATVVMLAPAVSWVVRDLRNRRYGADLLAVLALGSTLAVGEFLAGGVIALMVATGRLEASAQRRAGRDLDALMERLGSGGYRRRGDPQRAARGPRRTSEGGRAARRAA